MEPEKYPLSETTATRATREWRDLRGLWRENRLLAVCVILFLFFPSLWAGYLHFSSIPKKDATILQLRRNIEDASTENGILLARLEPYQAMAIKLYPGESIDIALDKMADEISEIRTSLEKALEASKPRSISPESEHELLDILGRIRGWTVAIHYQVGAGETQEFANQIRRVFDNSGWAVRYNAVLLQSSSPNYGVRLYCREDIPEDVSATLARSFGIIDPSITGRVSAEPDPKLPEREIRITVFEQRPN